MAVLLYSLGWPSKKQKEGPDISRIAIIILLLDDDPSRSIMMAHDGYGHDCYIIVLKFGESCCMVDNIIAYN